MTGIIETHKQIDELFKNFGEFLIEKNRRYGNAAMQPMQVFNKLEAENSILIRLDDKLNRIKNGKELKKNDVADVFGYVALLMISKKWTDFKELLD